VRWQTVNRGVAFHTDRMVDAENHLILQLPRATRKKFLDRCEPFELVRSTDLGPPGQVLSHAYFPRGGFISLVIAMDSHPPLEVGMVGREAVLGAELVLGLSRTPWRALVQGEGASWRIGSVALREASDSLPELRQLLQRMVTVHLHQQALAAACERFHTIGPRLARWLLMGHDRAQSDRLHVTQECIALMLGVRRVGVTVAAGALQQRGLIAYHRGELTVLDRAALEAEACSCYAADKQLYADVMGDPKSR
jgi:CRP-like cAMP-binding protein